MSRDCGEIADQGCPKAAAPKGAVAALAMVFLLAGANVAQAALVLGDYLGTFSGNDSEASLLSDLGLTVSELARVETPATSNDGLILSNIAFNDDTPPEPVSGQWGFSEEGLVDIIVVKAGPNYAAFLYSDTNTQNMRNTGLWNTAQLNDKGMSHVTAYQDVSAVPLPATLPLLGSALAGLVVLGWRRRRQAPAT